LPDSWRSRGVCHGMWHRDGIWRVRSGRCAAACLDGVRRVRLRSPASGDSA
jgi:hypothetical protein